MQEYIGGFQTAGMRRYVKDFKRPLLTFFPFYESTHAKIWDTSLLNTPSLKRTAPFIEKYHCFVWRIKNIPIPSNHMAALDPDSLDFIASKIFK
jgi:hypothetical protein